MTAFSLAHYRAAIFDLDGTLVLSEPAWELSKRRLMDELGLHLPQSVYDAFVGRGVPDFLAEVLGPDLTDSRKAILANRIATEADLLLAEMRQPVPGAAEAVARLFEAGLRIAVCSSAPLRHIDAALQQLGVSDRVTTVVSAADLPRGKPDPMPYLETLRLLGIPPADAFAIEDALPGVRSAHAAGLAVIGIGMESLKSDFAPYCCFRVADFQDFRKLTQG